MSERGFVCTASSCFFKCHGDCHMNFCPRLDKAYSLLQKCVDMAETQTDPVEDEETIESIRDFLKEDKSWDPEGDRKRLEDERKTIQCDPKTCKAGSTFCCYFRRIGDDYGNCIKNGSNCPHGGFVDVSNLEVK